MKALIKVGYGCNDHCTFCHTYDVRHIDDTADVVAQKIRRAAALGHSMVVLSGGEPTMRPELLAWATLANKLGMDFGLVTNGRMLSYPALLDKLLARRLRYVYLSLHGGTAKIHDANVRSDAFEQTFGGLRNCSGKGLDLTANCVVTRVNVDHLRGLVDAVQPLPDVHLNFSMTEPKGNAMHLFRQVVPNLTHAAERVRDAIGYGLEKGMRGRISHGGFPLCLMPGLEDAYSDLKTHGFITMTEVWEDDYFPVDDRNKTQPEPCRECALQGPCPGQYNAYYSEYGADELRPVAGVRSNSFNYSEDRALEWPSGAPCPIFHGGVTPYDVGRSIFVRSGERMRLFKTATRDFSDAEIEATKRGLEQVYVDLSDKTAPDDFAADLRKLRVVEECRDCPAYDSCARCYEVLDEDVFTRDDADIRAMIGELRGDVLDVGCGDGRYGDILEPLVREGLVRYHGVEPHAPSAARLRERWPWASIDEAPIETLELEPGSFDHILVLRSYNHLEDPAAVLRTLVAALRPTGTLLIADNVAFALLRSDRQIERAEHGPAEFEHYRNAGADHAARAVGGLPLDLLRRADVTPESSNQWYLHYRRA
jgi:pyruvate-formate lyase-activating enzyme/SAM-dependent methyltransferase